MILVRFSLSMIPPEMVSDAHEPSPHLHSRFFTRDASRASHASAIPSHMRNYPVSLFVYAFNSTYTVHLCHTIQTFSNTLNSDPHSRPTRSLASYHLLHSKTYANTDLRQPNSFGLPEKSKRLSKSSVSAYSIIALFYNRLVYSLSLFGVQPITQ
jgi:hypothetical protein